MAEERVCVRCESVAAPKVKTSAAGWLLAAGGIGSLVLVAPIAPVLGILGFFTFLGFSLGFGRTYSCASCQATELVPTDSPAGRKLLGQ